MGTGKIKKPKFDIHLPPPPHTHGLHKEGMPELLLAHSDFSMNDIQTILGSCANFLWKSPEVLQAIRDGEAPQIAMEDITGQTKSEVKFEVQFRLLDFNSALVQLAFSGMMEHEGQEFVAVYVHEMATRH